MATQLPSKIKSPNKKPGGKKDAAATVIMREFSELKPDPANPRKNDHAVEQLATMIGEFGFRVPILVRGDDIVDGHLRYKAAEKLGLKQLPAIDVSDMSDVQIRQFRLAVNRAAELAEWDDELLAPIFADLDTMGADLELTGFDPATIQGFLKGMTDAAAVPDGDGASDSSDDTDAGDELDEPDEAETTTSKSSHQTVNLSFSLTPQDRKMIVTYLRKVQKQQHLMTVADALVSVVGNLVSKKS